MSKNERITEGLIRDRLRLVNYFDSDTKVEEKKSDILEITRLLKTAGLPFFLFF